MHLLLLLLLLRIKQHKIHIIYLIQPNHFRLNLTQACSKQLNVCLGTKDQVDQIDRIGPNGPS